MIWLAVGATMVPPYTAVPVFRLGVSIVKSMMYWGSSAGAKHMKDTTTSRVVFLVPVLSAVPVLPPMR